MYTIKQVPEDFIVKEISDIKETGKGSYAIVLLRKKELSTQAAVAILADRLRIDIRRIGYAGAKDKEAITEQLISLEGVNKESIEKLEIKNAELAFFGYSKERINLGNLKGNRFEITVRNLSDEEIKKAAAIKKKDLKFPNYFDEQRFSKYNYIIGKSILKKDFECSIKYILNFSFEKGEINSENYGQLKKKSKNIVTTRILSHLINNKNDFVGAIRVIPKKTALIYIHSVQSFLFNEILREYIRKKSRKNSEVAYSLGTLIFPKNQVPDIEIPLVGFGTDISNGTIGKIVQKILQKEGLKERDFVVSKIPELSSEGGVRMAFAHTKNIVVGKQEPDERNIGRKKMIISFELEKACYATMFIRSLFC